MWKQHLVQLFVLLFKHVVQEFITAVTQNYLHFMPIFMDTVTTVLLQL